MQNALDSVAILGPRSVAQLMLKERQSAQSTVNCNPEHVMTEKAGGLSNHELHASNQERTPAYEALVSWARRFLACNPFYLVSAALLLYGIYRVSVDPAMGGHEVLQLCFNLSSLEVYEALLVLTAIFLARRLIWYDSTLLMALENLFVLVPFILISQAALIDSQIVWLFSITAGALVTSRCACLRRFIPRLNLPGRLLVIGALILLVNVALPIVFRVLHESKVGTKPDWGAAYQLNQYAWWVLMPALCCGVIVIPRALKTPHPPPNYRLMPLGWFTLWFLGTGVHLYCLGYIYDFSLRPDLLAPAIWMLLWVVQLRVPDLMETVPESYARALWALPIAATLLALGQPARVVFIILTGLDLVIHGSISFRKPDQKLSLHLLSASLVLLLAGMPSDWGRTLLPQFTSSRALAFGAAVYFLTWALLSRSPKMGVFGAIVCATALWGLFPGHPEKPNWAIQGALVFLVLHSLRWQDASWEGARILRFVALLFWVGHSGIWAHCAGGPVLTYVLAGLVLSAWIATRWLLGSWTLKPVALASVLVMLSGPADFTLGTARSAPSGLLAFAGSFLLFALGTAAALTKHRWNKPHEPVTAQPSKDETLQL